MLAHDWILVDNPEDVKMGLTDIEEDQEEPSDGWNLSYKTVCAFLEVNGGVAWRKAWEKWRPDMITLRHTEKGIIAPPNMPYEPGEDALNATDWKWRKD